MAACHRCLFSSSVFVVLWSCFEIRWLHADRVPLHVDFVTTGFFGLADHDVTSLSYNAPVILTAVQHLRNIYPEHHWTSTFVYDESIQFCLPMTDNIQNLLTGWYYTRRNATSISIIVASPCTEGVYISMLAAAYNILLVTSSGAGAIIKDRQRSPTWLSTTPFAALDQVYCSLLTQLNWSPVFVCFDIQEKTFQAFAFLRLKATLARCGVQFTAATAFSSTDESTTSERVLMDFSATSRVFLYFGKPQGLRKLLIQAVRLNMTDGEYVYLAVVSWTSDAFGNFTWHASQKDDEVVKFAYRSVLLLTLVEEARYATAMVKNLTDKWKLVSKQVFNNSGDQLEQALPILTATHAAVELSGIAVVEALKQSRLPEGDSGKQLADSLMNRTFELQVGSWRLKSNGLSQYHVQLSFFDGGAGVFKVFLKASDTNDGDVFYWTNTSQRLDWYGRSILPTATPRCGFDGASVTCANNGKWVVQAVASCLAAVLLVCGAVGATIVRLFRRERSLRLHWWRLDTEAVNLKDTVRSLDSLSQ